MIKTDSTDSTPLLQREPVVLLMAVAATFLWGTAIPSIKLGYQLFQIGGAETASQMLFAGSRFIWAGILTILPASLLQRRLLLPAKREIGGILLLGLVQTTLEYVFFYISLTHISGTKGAILNSTGAFIGVLLAHFFCKGERMNRNKALGCIIGFGGIIVINLGGDFGGFSFSLMGEGFMILAALAMSVGAVISQKIAQGSDPITITGWQLFVGGVALWLIGVAGGGKMQPVSPVAWALLTYMALLSAVAFTLWTVLLKYNPVAKVSIYNSLTPVFGTFLSGLLLHENVFQVKNLTALTLVCVGIYVVNRPKAPGLSAAQ